MAENKGQQGTGRHPHKDTQEPWPHTREDDGRHHTRQHEAAHSGGGSHGRSGSHQGSENADLKRREYRDEKGEVHHHTHTYGGDHGGKKDR